MVLKIKEDTTKIHLDTICMGGITLIFWGSRTQEDMEQHDKIISSWVDFISALRKQLYPLAYTQTSMIEWLHLT